MLFKGEKSLFPRMRYDYVIEEKKKYWFYKSGNQFCSNHLKAF